MSKTDEAYLACRMRDEDGAIALYHVTCDVGNPYGMSRYSIDWVSPHDDSYTFYLNAHDMGDAIDRATQGSFSETWRYDKDVTPMARILYDENELTRIEWATRVDHWNTCACTRPCDRCDLTLPEPITQREYLDIAEDYAKHWQDLMTNDNIEDYGYENRRRRPFKPRYFVGNSDFVSVLGVVDGSHVTDSDLISYMSEYDRDEMDLDHKLCIISVFCENEPVEGGVHDKPWTCEAQVFSNDPETGELTSFWIGPHKTAAESWSKAVESFPFIEMHADEGLSREEADAIDSGPDKPEFATAVAPNVKKMGLTTQELGLPERGFAE